MPRTLEHSYKVFVLKALIQQHALYARDIFKLFPDEDKGKVEIAIARLLDVKFIIRVSGVADPAYAINQIGRAAYDEYDSELAID